MTAMLAFWGTGRSSAAKGEAAPGLAQRVRVVAKAEDGRWTVDLRAFALIINLIILVVCTVIMVYQCLSSIILYFQYNTKATLTVIPTGDTTFLVFTVCPAFEVAYNSSALSALNTSIGDFKNGAFYGSNSNASADGYALFRGMSFSANQLISTISVSTASTTNASVSIDFSKTMNPNVANVTQKYDRTFGRCFSVQLSEWLVGLGVINVVINGKMSIYVYMHHPGQYMDNDSKTKVFATAGNMLFIDMTHELDENTLENFGDLPCNASMNIYYDECVYSSISTALMSEFGCVVPWLPPNTARPVCRFDNTTDGAARKTAVMNRYTTLASSGLKDLCPLPCATFTVFLGMPFPGAQTPPASYIKIYVKSTVKVKQTVLNFTFLSMLAELGGYTGLWLGLAVVNLTDIIEKLLGKWFIKKH